MAYLNVHLNFREHPKVVRFGVKLGNTEAAEAYVLRLWLYTGKFHCKDGLLRGYTELEVLSAINCTIPGVVKMLCEPGIELLKKCTRGYIVVDFLQHNGHIKAFKKRASEAAKKRWSNEKADANSNATSIDKQSSSNALSNPSNPALPTNLKEIKITDFFTPKELETLSDKICKARNCTENSLAFGVAMEEIKIKLAQHKPKNSFKYAMKIVINEAAAA